MGRGLFLSMIVLGATALPASAQQRTPSPFSAVLAGPTVEHAAERLHEPQFFSPPAGTSQERLAVAMLLGAAGSFAGMYGGAFGAYAASSHEDPILEVYLGAGAGSLLGSTLGAGLVTGSPGKAFLGSLGGGVLGLAIANGMYHLNEGLTAFVAYSVVQGVTAALVSAR